MNLVTELQKLQDYFSETSRVFIWCIDSENRNMTKMSGNPVEAACVMGFIGESALNDFKRALFTRAVCEPALIRETSRRGFYLLGQQAVCSSGERMAWMAVAIDRERAKGVPFTFNYVSDMPSIMAALGYVNELCGLIDRHISAYQRFNDKFGHTDQLTGISNRHKFERDMSVLLRAAKRDGSKGAVLYFDIDDFQHINDGLGHQCGDNFLRLVAKSVRDIPEISDYCYRISSDEFAVIITPEHHSRLTDIIGEVRAVFEKPWTLEAGDYYCSVSMGMVSFPMEEDRAADVLKKAELTMYEAKNSGKNHLEIYTDKIEKDSAKRLDLEKRIRDAAMNNLSEFEVYYQPIIATDRRGRDVCCGAEALLRWNNSEMGHISPAEFIPLAERLGLIHSIGTHVLREACRTCKHWNDSGYPHFKINVNLSVIQLLQKDIVDIIEGAVCESGISPRNLTLEVTESLAIEDMNRMKQVLAEIKKLGVRVALDDFGIGYSSLNHIREIPLDVIKIDQSFITSLGKDDYAKAFVRMVSQLADTIGVNICVEGIETQLQYDALEDIHVSMIQGYFFDRPMTRSMYEQKYIIPMDRIAG